METADMNEYVVPGTMQAVVSSGVGFENLELREIPVPKPGPGQLLARVDAAGVCTSILKLVAQGPDHTFVNGWDMQKWPLVLGDEGAVTLVQVGDKLKGSYGVGERYAIQPAVDVDPINNRERYRDNAAGMHKCAVGYTLQGLLAQYVLIPEEVLSGKCLLPLPDNKMSNFAVSMAEPISCVFSAQEHSVHILKDGPHAKRTCHLGMLPGGITLIVGAGAMGRMHAELALRYSPGTLIVTARTHARLNTVANSIADKAREMNTELVCITADKLVETVNKVSGGRGVDDIILAVGIQSVQQAALELLAEGGVANSFGGLPRGKHVLEVNSLDVHYRGIKLVGSSGGEPSDMAATLNAIVKGDIDPGNYVAAVGSLDKAVDVLEMIKAARIDGKAILYPHIKSTPLHMVDRWTAGEEEALLTGE